MCAAQHNPERICIFGTDGTELITDLDTLRAGDYFGKLDTNRKEFNFSSDRYIDYQEKNPSEYFDSTEWLRSAVKEKLDTTQLNLLIRYGQLNNILCRVGGLFNNSEEKRTTVHVQWDQKNNIVSLYNAPYTYASTGLEFAALQDYVTKKSAELEDNNEIQLGKKESYAAYKIKYQNIGTLIVSKNPDGRLSEELTEDMALVELKCLEKKKNVQTTSIRRLLCFTDIATKIIRYDREENTFSNLTYEDVTRNDPTADQNDHHFLKCLLKVLRDRKNDADPVDTISFYSRKNVEVPKVCLMQTSAGSMWIYDMSNGLPAASPEQSASGQASIEQFHEKNFAGQHLLGVLPFY